MKRSFCILAVGLAALTAVDSQAQSEPQCIVLRPPNTHNNLKVVQNVPEAGTTAALFSFSALGVAWAARRFKRSQVG